MSLSDLLVESKEISVEFPGAPGFEVTLAYLGKDTLTKLRKKSTITKIDKKSRKPTEELDSDLFQSLYVGSVVKGWTGCKYKYLQDLIPMNEVPEEALDKELEFSTKDAELLLTNSTTFDAWVAELVSDLQTFTQSK